MLRWVAAGGDRRRALPPARRPAVRRRSSAIDVPVISPAELEGVGVHRGPPARVAAGRLPGAVGDRRRGRAASCAPASASSTPTTAASTRPPTSAASASTTTPSCASPTTSSATSSTCCRRGPCCSSRPITARSRSATGSSTPDADAAGDGGDAVGRGSLPVVARRPRLGGRAGQGGDRRLRRRRLGRHPRADPRRALVRAERVRDRSPPVSATSPSWPARR